MDAERQTALDWIEANRSQISADHLTIWNFHEPAWREYRAARWYVDRLRQEGFDVEVASGGMPTAFAASWTSPAGAGPTIAAWAEYDAVPGNSQEAVPYEQPRAGVSKWAAGFTEPHSAIGVASLAGVLAAKAAMTEHGIKGTIRYFGEPAENVCGGKVFHASKGYYDNIDAAIGWRSSPMPALTNTCALDTLCGCLWSKVYTFEHIEEVGAPKTKSHTPQAASTPQASARAPGALDALCLMYTTTKYSRDSMLPNSGSWALNEAILANGSATANNLPPRIAHIQYTWRCPNIEMAESILTVLDHNAEQIARLTHTKCTDRWVSKTRPGLPNHALAELTYANFEKVGPPQWDEAARSFARRCQGSLGIDPMVKPFADGLDCMTPPQIAEDRIRETLPSWQTHLGTDDIVEYTWHAPTARILVARPRLAPPSKGYVYPSWVGSAMGGTAAVINPVIETAAKVIATTMIELFTSPSKLSACKAEFDRRTGGGIGGTAWVGPLLDKSVAPPLDCPWPEYATTERGFGWCLPREI